MIHKCNVHHIDILLYIVCISLDDWFRIFSTDLKRHQAIWPQMCSDPKYRGELIRILREAGAKRFSSLNQIESESS